MLVANYASLTAHNRSLILVRLDQYIRITLSENFVHQTKFFVVLSGRTNNFISRTQIAMTVHN